MVSVHESPVPSTRQVAALPEWYWWFFSLASLGLVVAPLITQLASQPVAQWTVLTPSVAVYALIQPVARRLRGAGLWSGDAVSRRAASIIVGVAAVGDVAVLVLAHRRLTLAAAVLVVVAGAAIVATNLWRASATARHHV